ncbi:DUF4751 family protein [Leptolyngbya cf. ectocarpi LEGE 11479]|uniref:DUF4751 family protein n=1 Tax=Leptolyngbya cf. ectocarpi LEGE 11479 TaxID=1828722 RepID=A0A928ZX14_LEPEC|nr:DUF4751 family protein [Leptolyngbya ectocarpi]MBE9069056.1 DUF4751 family protein [Leptolyngbya cf. ectocarpi LEGE 11479]
MTQITQGGNGHDILTADTFSQENVFKYISWDGSKWSFKREGDVFVHAPNGDFSTEYKVNLIRYKLNGVNWAAKIEGDEIIHARNGDFSVSHPDTIMHYTDWGGSIQTARFANNAFIRASVGEDFIEYTAWDGSWWLARKEGNGFREAPNGDWNKARSSNIINYMSGGQKWTAKVDGEIFTHARHGDFTSSHTDNIIAYQTWGGVTQIATANGNRFNSYDNFMDGGAGDDTMRGSASKDLMRGNTGNDKLVGNAGADVLLGGNGNDTLIGDSEFAELFEPIGKTASPHYGVQDGLSEWPSFDRYPRQLADVNGDGRADIVAFGHHGVGVALGQQDGTFSEGIAASSHYGVQDGSSEWPSFNRYPRQLADVNGDGRADIVAFGHHGVGVALGQQDGTFSEGIAASPHYGVQDGSSEWPSFDRYPRQLADVNGDGRADIVAFGHFGVEVALGQQDGTFSNGIAASSHFGVQDGSSEWPSFNRYPRQLADVNGDGRADIVAFGHYGTMVVLGQQDGTFSSPIGASPHFGVQDGSSTWSSFDRYPRQLADVNGDGRADIVAFGHVGTSVAFGQEDGKFGSPVAASNHFGVQDGASTWSSFGRYPRQIADVNGDGLADVVAFSHFGVNVALSDGEAGLTGSDDILKGGAGDDTLIGGAGRNTLWGDDGNDTFVLDEQGVQIIKDFERGSDKIDVNGADVSNIAFEFTETGTNVLVEQKQAAFVEGVAIGSQDITNASNQLELKPIDDKDHMFSYIRSSLEAWTESYAESVEANPGLTKVDTGNLKLQIVDSEIKVIEPGKSEDKEGNDFQPDFRTSSMLLRNRGTAQPTSTITWEDTKQFASETRTTVGGFIGGKVSVSVEQDLGTDLLLATEETKLTAAVEVNFQFNRSVTTVKRNSESGANGGSYSLTAPPNSVTLVTAQTSGILEYNPTLQIPVLVSGDVSIDLNGDGDLTDAYDIAKLPVNAILQSYRPDLFKGEGGMDSTRLYTSPTDQKLAYQEVTRAILNEKPKGTFIGETTANAVTTYDHDLSSPTIKQLEEGFVEGIQGSEDRYWLLRGGTEPHRASGDILRIDGFEIANDFIGIDHPTIGRLEQVHKATDLLLGQDPGSSLILREMVDIQGRTNTQILYGGTGDLNTIDDNTILVELSNVNMNDLISSQGKNSSVRGGLDSSLIFGAENTIFDKTLAHAGGAFDLTPV